jgi:calcineurin-like phosphoesterase family protein
MIYFISDTHFGHAGSLRWPDGNARKFTDVHEMNSVMVDNWNNTIKKEDTVYFLGDFAYKTSDSLIRRLFETLNGKIVFIIGNHDGQTLKVNQKHPRFESVNQLVKIDTQGKWIILCHYPIQQWEGKGGGAIHLHGHVHGRPTGISGNIMDVSCEALDYKPISIDDIINKYNYE